MPPNPARHLAGERKGTMKKAKRSIDPYPKRVSLFFSEIIDHVRVAIADLEDGTDKELIAYASKRWGGKITKAQFQQAKQWELALELGRTLSVELPEQAFGFLHHAKALEELGRVHTNSLPQAVRAG